METLDELGDRRRQLLAELDELTPKLADAIRAARAQGGPDATYARLMIRSGYGSIEGIKQIIDPKRREQANADRRSSGVPAQ